MSLLMLPSSKKLNVALIVVVLVGVGLLVAGALKNYGPLYLMGGIWIGFALGIQLARRATKSALESAVDGLGPDPLNPRDWAAFTVGEVRDAADREVGRLHRVRIVNRQTGYPLAAGASVFAGSDIEAYETLRKEYPRDKYKLFDRETGEEVDLEGR